MGTLSKKYATSAALHSSMGIFARSVVNQHGKIVTNIPGGHPSMISKFYQSDQMPRAKNSEQMRVLVGDRHKIDSAGSSFIELNVTPSMVQFQLDQAMQSKETPMGQYVQSIFNETYAKHMEETNRRAAAQGKRPLPHGYSQPPDAQAELAQLDLSTPIKRPIQLTPDMVALDQMKLAFINDRNTQAGGLASVYDPNAYGYYTIDPNSNKRARLGGITEGYRAFMGDRMESHLVSRGVNPPFAKDPSPFSNPPGREPANGTNAPDAMLVDQPYNTAMNPPMNYN